MASRIPDSLRSVFVNVMDSVEIVSVDISSLPDDVDELFEFLAAEAAPLSIWFDLARAYLAQGNEAAFTKICQEGCNADVVSEVRRCKIRPDHCMDEHAARHL